MKKTPAHKAFFLITSLSLVFLIGVKISYQSIGRSTDKEIASGMGENENKTESEKQADDSEYNKEQLLTESPVFILFEKDVKSAAILKAYINHYLPTHYLSIQSPPPDVGLV